MKRLSIHSDGFGPGTFILDEDGKKLEGVVSATIYLEASEPNRVSLDILVPSANMTVHLDNVTLICPSCKEGFDHRCGGDTLGGGP